MSKEVVGEEEVKLSSGKKNQKEEEEEKHSYWKNGLGLKIFEKQYYENVGKKCKGIVVFVHGFADYSLRHSELKDALLKANFAVYFFDSQGMGRSGGVRAHITDWKHYANDLEKVLTERIYVGEGQKLKEAPVFIVAHSLGCLHTMYLEVLKGIQKLNSRVRCCVLATPGIATAVKLGWMQKKALQVASMLFPEMGVANIKEGGQVGSRDPEVVKSCETDELMLKDVKITAKWAVSFNVAQQYLEDNIKKVTIPLFYMLSEADLAVPFKAVQSLIQKMENSKKETFIFKKLYHDLFHEPEKEKVFELTINYFNKFLTEKKEKVEDSVEVVEEQDVSELKKEAVEDNSGKMNVEELSKEKEGIVVKENEKIAED